MEGRFAPARLDANLVPAGAQPQHTFEAAVAIGRNRGGEHSAVRDFDVSRWRSRSLNRHVRRMRLRAFVRRCHTERLCVSRRQQKKRYRSAPQVAILTSRPSRHCNEARVFPTFLSDKSQYVL